ncbi:hypothetical protein IF650_02085 [Cellulosimicrobium terreum]|nr:hypothetical protein [Cellulosimicrobium terreum]
MGFLDRLLGREPQDRPTHEQHHGAAARTDAPAYGTPPPSATRPGYAAPAPTGSTDDVAVERYRYLLRTAPPDAIERAHAEAFAQLTPAQRQRVLAELGDAVPAEERALTDAPQDLARMATRAEVRRPGTLERTFDGAPGGAVPGSGPGLGAMFGTSMLGTVAGVVVGSTVASMLFGPMFGDTSQQLAGDPGSGSDGGASDNGGPEASADGGGSDTGADGGGFDGGFGDDLGGFGGFDGF